MIMHQHRTMCSNACVYQHPTSCQQHHYYHQHHYHHGTSLCSSCDMPDPLPPIPLVCGSAPTCYYDYPCRRNIPYVDYVPRPPPPPIIQTNVHNDIYYYIDDSHDDYSDDYGHPYRLSRSKIQLVDIRPKPKPRRTSNHMVVSTFQPDDNNTPERIIIPRSTVIRNNRNSSIENRRGVRLVPLNRSSDLQYVVPSERRSVVREVVPLATVMNSHPNKQTIKVRSLSPL